MFQFWSKLQSGTKVVDALVEKARFMNSFIHFLFDPGGVNPPQPPNQCLFAGKERFDGLKYNIKGFRVHRGKEQFCLNTFVPHRNCYYEELVED